MKKTIVSCDICKRRIEDESYCVCSFHSYDRDFNFNAGNECCLKCRKRLGKAVKKSCANEIRKIHDEEGVDDDNMA